jgi:hypothetical protein
MRDYLVVFKKGEKLLHSANCIGDVYTFYSTDYNEADDTILLDPEITEIREYDSTAKFYYGENIKRGLRL